MINLMGEVFQKILGDEYDIIGFDPRGTYTTPANCAEIIMPFRCGTYNTGRIGLL